MIIQQQNSHQWFGNLITCSWWDFVWLNEGFARYFQYFATEMVSAATFTINVFVTSSGVPPYPSIVFQVKPDWRLKELFVIEQHQRALEFDQTPRHPVTASVKTSDQIQEIFDLITYNKAAAILRMLKCTVTDSNFHEPLKLYLKHFK
jgi:aminopeptidase N